MPRYSVTFFVVILMLCFGIFFGIELATRGMANIQGPAPGYAQQGQGGVVAQQQGQSSANGGQSTNAGAAQQSGTSAGAGGKAMPQAGNAAGAQATASPPTRPQPPQPQPIAADSGINRVGNQIGDMLQSVAHGTIRTIVSLLDSIVN
ncbi:hypothetical protein FE784_01695 [Paenibacillus hemerocallicola]|uniref:Translation initiation factor 2 n=1 Tax=Paenibacillus hemerocallicola TaxID=1172614 RepID=A0A5C4TFE8_9BACL|nr:hypothetical protein [Paenibacillus hemerocallicola]TNJ67884.1 hypothetical protein FE784_01695 [Paenibacillus hemerocallicola]